MAIEGFSELQDDFQDMADAFERLSDRHDLTDDSVRAAISESIDEVGTEQMVPDAKENTPKDTGRLANSITYESRGWSGNTYRYVFGPTIDEEYAKVQEYGTRKKGYKITPKGDGYPLRFIWDPPNGPGHEVRFMFVVHPGVEGQHYVRDALRDNVRSIQGKTGPKIQKAMRDQL